jgi:hypothetical protein
MSRPCAVAIACCALFAIISGCATNENAGKPAVTMLQDGSAVLSNGLVEATVSPTVGRITRFGFVGGRNVLWTNPKQDIAGDDWPNRGGDKLWLWPQAQRGSPPPTDPTDGPWTLRPIANGVVITSPVVKAFGVRLVRTITLEPGLPVMTVTNSVDVVDPSKAYDLALWNVAQVPAVDEVVATPLYPRTAGGQVRATFPKVMMEGKTESWLPAQPSLVAPSELIFRRPKNEETKVGVDTNSFRIKLGDTFFTQKAKFSPAAGPLVPEERGQLYTNPGDNRVTDSAYVEIEFVSPAWSDDDLKNGSLSITWTLWRPD